MTASLDSNNDSISIQHQRQTSLDSINNSIYRQHQRQHL